MKNIIKGFISASLVFFCAFRHIATMMNAENGDWQEWQDYATKVMQHRFFFLHALATRKPNSFFCNRMYFYKRNFVF